MRRRKKKLREKKHKIKTYLQATIGCYFVVIEVLLCYKKWLTSLFVIVASRYLRVAKVNP
jgi:hypothetical protein